MTMLYRHGDVLIARIQTLPRNAQSRTGTILAWGEVTGHSHRIQEAGAARLWGAGDLSFLEVTAPTATLIHEEHRAITLPRGLYRFWMQREYSPGNLQHWVED
jgi:hypothetical protein